MKITKSTTRSKTRTLPEASSQEIFLLIFSSQWNAFRSLQKKVMENSDPDDIHHLRTSLRRFRLSIKLYEYLTHKKAKNKFKKFLKKLTNNLGKLRNIDEAIFYFHAHTSYSSRHQLYKKLSGMRSAQLTHIKSMLNEFDHQHDSLVMDMIKNLKSIPYTEEYNISLLTHVSDVSADLSKTIHHHFDLSTQAKQCKSRHKLRIAIRKWRHHLELFAVVLNRDYTSLLKILKKYQTLLGRINDIVSFVKLCNDMSLSPPVDKLIKKSLLDEEMILLKKFTKLVKSNPL